MRLRTTILLFSTFYLFQTLFAQEMVTDRPDFTESAQVVPSKTVQIESGVEYQNFESFEELSYPNILARIGVGHRLEIRLGLSGWTNAISHNSDYHLNDLGLEAKYQVTPDDAALPMALILVSTFPTGDDEVSAGATEFGLKFASAYDINNRLGIGFNLGAISVAPGNEREIFLLGSASLGLGITNKLSAFIETFAEIPPHSNWQPVLDGGVTYLLSPLAQLDLYLGKGLNDEATDFIIGAGFSFRFGY
ncbi:transporter [candidate division KSB1 bacterium]|nr:transporter [candidate division KSB1 bacterium]